MENKCLSCMSSSACTTLFSLRLLSFLVSIFGILSSTSGIVLPIIHRSSPKSPFYNPDVSPTCLHHAAALSSIARSQYFAQRDSFLPLKTDGHVDEFFEYVLKMGIGTPPLEAYFIPDMGNSLVLLQCLSCIDCHNQTTSLFDPMKSSSYANLSCQTSSCEAFDDTDCDSEGLCHYSGSYFNGTIAAETFMLQYEFNPGNINLTSMIFGCGHSNFETKTPAGIAGLSMNSISLVGQLGYTKFSYCLSSNHSAGHSIMKFGHEVPSVSTTPLLTMGDHGLYFVNVEDINVAGFRLNIPKWVFETSANASGSNGFIIDMGTMYTVLRQEAFDEVEYMVAKFMVVNNLKTPFPVGPFELCFDDVARFPAVAIVLEGLTFEFTWKNTWIKISPRTHCLAILRGGGMSILGMYQQRDVNVGFDLMNKIISLHDDVCLTVRDYFDKTS